jgi:ankyrin repeat protein
VARLLTKKGASVRHEDSSGTAPLHWAAERGNEAVVRFLIGDGAFIHHRDSSGKTSLQREADQGHEAVVGLLSASVDSKND